MAQGDNKMGQKGVNAMFVMTHDKIVTTLAAHPNNNGGGNLINSESSASIQTADLDTAKLHWSSVISTKRTRYMCLDIKNFYLTAALEYYNYRKIPLTLFPTWIREQYSLNQHAIHGFIHLEMQRAV